MKKSIALLLVAVMLLSAVACASGSANKLVGTWVLDSGVGEEAETSVALMKAFGMEMSIEFKSDGTGKINMSLGDDADSSEFKYEFNDGQIKILDVEEDSDAGSMKLDGNKLIMEYENMQLVFKKK